ncbi:hypothetical protein GCM10010331_46710 [Streptomyces xanthochromogenes]|nr:hypothetical protein [Streptomyces xanthochromogenes]GHB53837.1 hypothetical protein GCM10010331_46710 [Streptomyces xanthochromogenes]
MQPMGVVNGPAGVFSGTEIVDMALRNSAAGRLPAIAAIEIEVGMDRHAC